MRLGYLLLLCLAAFSAVAENLVVCDGALKEFRWPAELSEGNFTNLADATALGANRIHLTPAQRTAALQWSSGDEIRATYDGKVWKIEAGETADTMREIATVEAPDLELASYGTGAIVRAWGSGKPGKLIEGGLTQSGLKLALPEGVPMPEIVPVEFINEALQLCYLEEAARQLAEGKAQFDRNLPILKEHWQPDNNVRPWTMVHEMISAEVKRIQAEAQKQSAHLAETLVADPILRDRYNCWVWLSYCNAAEPGSYFGGHFRKIWFTHLGGTGVYRSAVEWRNKARRMVSRARRCEWSSFAEGITDGKRTLSAAWVNSLTAVPQAAGLPDNLAKTLTLHAARGEAESAQLVLSGGKNAVPNCQIRVDRTACPGVEVETYLVRYITLAEPAYFMMPDSPGGDTRWPDVLEPLAEQSFAVGAEENQSIWFTVRPTADAQPGEYTIPVEVLADGKTLLKTSLTLSASSFVLSSHSLFGKAGMRNSNFDKWYPREQVVEARHNFMENMFRHQMDPLDGYQPTPVAEDLPYAKKLGMKTFTLGGDLDYFAPPLPDMGDGIRLFTSEDGLTYKPVECRAVLEKREPDNPLSDYDLVITPQNGALCARYVKVHDAERRGWLDRVTYQFFWLYPDGKKPSITLFDENGTAFRPGHGEAAFLKLDENPEHAEKLEFPAKLPGFFAFGSLKSGEDKTSIILKTNDRKVREIRLSSRKMEVGIQSIQERYRAFRAVSPESELVLYGFDETGAHLNGQLLAAARNARIAFPDPKVKIRTSASNIDAMPEIYSLVDQITRANAYSTPRAEARIHRQTGVSFQIYVGGGGYYPFGGFERCDQPFVISRAFFWSFIAFDHFTAWGYFDGHYWRKNAAVAGQFPIDFSRWNPTHGQYNGMGAFYYPGPDAQSWPGIRAELMRDGIEDAILFRLAQKLLAEHPDAQDEAQLQERRREIAPSMSCFEQDPRKVAAFHEFLIRFCERLSKQQENGR